MALQSASPPTVPNAQMVGNAFVEQYYHILHNSPELVYRFYQDSSFMSRPSINGEMTAVTTMEGINQKILSMDYKDCKAEIKTADAQKSYKDGVMLLVTGCLTGKDSVQRNFTQSFFLAPQDNGFFVLNDVFRYVDGFEGTKMKPVNEVDDSSTTILSTNPEPSHVQDPSALNQATSIDEENHNVSSEEALDGLDNERQVATEESVAMEPQSHSNGNDVSSVVESSSPAHEAPKKSYASIVRVQGSSGHKVYVPTNTVKATPVKTEKPPAGSVTPPPMPEALGISSVSPSGDSNSRQGDEGYSIYVRNLPLNMADSQLEAAFREFGPIKPGGIQVRNHKQGYCFGFVEFESMNSVKSAIEASPVSIGGRQAVVEMKRTTTRVMSGRGRFPPARGGLWNESFRGRGNYGGGPGGGGGRGYARADYGNRVDYSIRGRGPVGRGGNGYQPRRGRGGRSSGLQQRAITT